MFKFFLAVAKKLLMERKKKGFLPMVLQATDIIPMLNYAWERSFAIVPSNKKAINQRGWYPFNRNLLLHPELIATMTLGEKVAAKDQHLLGAQKIFNLNAVNPNFNP